MTDADQIDTAPSYIIGQANGGAALVSMEPDDSYRERVGAAIRAHYTLESERFATATDHHLDQIGQKYGVPRRGATRHPPLERTYGGRRYLPTLSDLVDRITIVQQKAIFIHEHRDKYRAEIALIMHDIDVMLSERAPLRAEQIRAIIMIQLSNAYIWMNETRIRDGSSSEPDDVQLRLLKATHAVNGVRNTAKNVLSSFDGGRHDYKIDCFAADLVKQFGDWNVFE